jgi:hypothetical protein
MQNQLNASIAHGSTGAEMEIRFDLIFKQSLEIEIITPIET